MFKNQTIKPLGADQHKAPRTGGAVDHIAAASGVPILVLGVVQLIAPDLAAPLTAIEPGTGSAILGALWAVLGGLLTFGGIIRTRIVAIFAADFVLIAALAAVAVTLFSQPEFIPLMVHGAMAFFGVLSSGFARLTDKADLKRELRLLREQATISREPRQTSPGDQPSLTSNTPSSENRSE